VLRRIVLLLSGEWGDKPYTPNPRVWGLWCKIDTYGVRCRVEVLGFRNFTRFPLDGVLGREFLLGSEPCFGLGFAI
jgi:hypothetical protein